MNKQMMWIFVFVALIVGAFDGYYYEKSKLTSQMMMNLSLQQQLYDVKMKNEQLMKNQNTLLIKMELSEGHILVKENMTKLNWLFKRY